MRTKLALLALVLLSLAAVPAASAASDRVCGFIRASVPYTRHGKAGHWRVYVAGATSCRAAEQALGAVMHLGGAVHEGRDEARSFITFGAWHCPFGNMGFQTCNIPSHAPYRARALAVECARNGCPSRRPPSYFPQ